MNTAELDAALARGILAPSVRRAILRLADPQLPISDENRREAAHALVLVGLDALALKGSLRDYTYGPDGDRLVPRDDRPVAGPREIP